MLVVVHKVEADPSNAVLSIKRMQHVNMANT